MESSHAQTFMMLKIGKQVKDLLLRMSLLLWEMQGNLKASRLKPRYQPFPVCRSISVPLNQALVILPCFLLDVVLTTGQAQIGFPAGDIALWLVGQFLVIYTTKK